MIWIPCSQEMPDADAAVMTFSGDSCEPVWPGFWDGERWLDLANMPFQFPVTHWMNFPEPPEGQEDLLLQFMQEKCNKQEGLSVHFRDFYNAFGDWMTTERQKQPVDITAQKAVAQRLLQLGHPRSLHAGKTFFWNLGLKAEVIR